MGAAGTERPADPEQCARAVLMVRPATFYANPETLATNAFQHAQAGPAADTLAAARAEFDGVVAALRAAGVDVAVADADADAMTPDALFPNNWFSTHADGRVVLYPMAAASRRRERRPDMIARLAERYGWRITRTTDLTALETRGLIVEGTGSLVLDRTARLAYAALSPRTHREAVDIACRELGYEPVAFHAHDTQGREVYHTNVLMSVGPSLAVLASSLVSPGTDLRRVFDALERTSKTLLEISAEQVAEFAGNLLFLDAGVAGPVVVVSQRAWRSLTRAQRQLLEKSARPVPCAVDTIEHVGGGSIRCMLAEIFLPGAAPARSMTGGAMPS
ncbi:MAG TPA: arginine deiminase-related protein [Steroidobacteraceae bacterium]|nr:arginine deiminase-related protein [Steroidobacteraceae bacterium]